MADDFGFGKAAGSVEDIQFAVADVAELESLAAGPELDNLCIESVGTDLEQRQ